MGDQGNHRVQQFSEAGTYVGQFGASGTGDGQFALASPLGIAADNKGGLWVTDVANNRIQKWVLPAYRPKFNNSYGSSGTGDGQFSYPSDVAVDSEGHVWVADNFAHRLQQFKANGEFISKFGTNGTGTGQLNWPAAIAIDAEDNIWVADAANRVQKFDPSGKYLLKIGSAGSGNGQFSGWGPEGIAIDPKGNIWVSDTAAGRVQKFSPSGAFIKVIGSKGAGVGQLGEPTDIDFDAQGNAWIADWQNNRISIFGEDGTFIRQFGSAGTGEGQFKRPDALEIDANGTVWIADHENHRVQAFNEANEYLTQFGVNGTGDSQLNLGHIMGLESDRYGRLWITDTFNARLKKWKIPDWIIPHGEENDPSVAIETSEGLVASVEGEEAGEHNYEHDGDLLTAHDGPEGETSYEYDSAGRMTKVTLANGTWGAITYNTTYNRVSSVTVDPAGSDPAKTTYFGYEDAPSRRATVTPPGAPVVTYDIGDDGSLLKSWNTIKPPEITLTGLLVNNLETSEPIASGTYDLTMTAHSEEGIESIDLIANGNTFVDEKVCKQDYGTPEIIECTTESNEWILETTNHPPGILYLEVVVEDRMEQTASKRFWVNIPPPPPPASEGTPVKPKFADVLHFREEHGLDLDLDPVSQEEELNDRVFDTINGWTEGNPVARGSWERWGVPLHTPEVAELEYRIAYQAQAAEEIPTWAQTNASGTYAGFYIDERAGGLIRVGFKQDPTGSTLDALKAASGNPAAGSRYAAFTHSPAYSLTELNGLEAQIETLAEANPSLPIHTFSIDVENNRVEVRAGDVQQVTAALTNAFGAGTPFIVSYSEARTVPTAGRERKTGPIQAGDRTAEDGKWEGHYCTAGFGAWERDRNPSTNAIVNRYFMITAGHCVTIGEKSRRRGFPNDSDAPVFGVTTRNGMDTVKSTWDTDGAAIRLLDRSLTPRYIYTGEGYAIPIKGVVEPRPNMEVCQSGVTSNKVRCGKITGVATRVAWDEPGENEKTMQTIFDEVVLGGDSGSPVWQRGTHYAIGLITAGDLHPVTEEYIAPSYITPLLQVQARPHMPGIFRDPDLAPLHLFTAE